MGISFDVGTLSEQLTVGLACCNPHVYFSGVPSFFNMKYSSYTRRDFFRLTGATVAGATLFGSLRKGYAATEVDPQIWETVLAHSFAPINAPPLEVI